MFKLKLGVYSLLYCLTIVIFVSTLLVRPHPIENIWMLLLRYGIILFATVLLLKYTLYLFICPWYELGARSRSQPARWHSYEPLVSVIIPAWNEEVGLLSTVKTLLESSYRHLELVIVNDGS